MFVLAQPPLSVRTHHKFRKIPSLLSQKVQTSAFEEPPCPQNVCTGQTPSPDCGRLLWTALMTTWVADILNNTVNVLYILVYCQNCHHAWQMQQIYNSILRSNDDFWHMAAFRNCINIKHPLRLNDRTLASLSIVEINAASWKMHDKLKRYAIKELISWIIRAHKRL